MNESWKLKSISEIGEVISGGTPSTKIKEYWDGNIVWVTPADLSKLSFPKLSSSSKRISEKGLKNSSANIIPKNNIVMSSRAPIGYFAVPEVDFTTNQGCKSIRLFEGEFSLFHYYNFLHRVAEFKRRGEGTTFAELSKKEIEKLSFYVPGESVQKKIATILSTCDSVIEKTEASIAKYEAIKKGMMQDLFTRGIDLKTGKLRPKYEDAPEMYKPSELGIIPTDWSTEKLEDLADYVDYRGKTPPKTETGIFLITAKNIKSGYIDYEISKEYIKAESYSNTMSRGLPEIGDVLITTEAPLGNVAQINIEGLALAQRVIKYRCKPEKMLNDFLSYILMSETFQRDLYRNSTGSTVMGIKGSRLHKIEVAKPEKPEQQKIVDSLKSLDKKIRSDQLNLEKYKEIKSGLMQDLLSGKVEVTMNKEELAN